MDSDLCREKLNKVIEHLPKLLKYKYILCDHTDMLFEHAEKILKIEQDKLRKSIYKELASKKYWIDRKISRSYNNKTILGLSTNPILINSGEMQSMQTVIFTYLHEAGHLIGYTRRHKSKLHSEAIADKIATYWYFKLKEKINI